MEIICPKCTYKRKGNDDLHTPITNCPECGIAYAKFDQKYESLTVKPQIRVNSPPKAIKPNRSKGFINIKTATMVADFFLGTAVLLLVLIAISVLANIFTSKSILSWWMIGSTLGLVTAEAWFGYVIKLLLGIYINTLAKKESA